MAGLRSTWRRAEGPTWALAAAIFGGASLYLAGGPVPNLLVKPEQSLLNAAVYALAAYASSFAALALKE